MQVADKGLNCARNIYAAVKEANDGYIFSKSIHGRNLSEKEKKWLLLENEQIYGKTTGIKTGISYTASSPAQTAFPINSRKLILKRAGMW